MALVLLIIGLFAIIGMIVCFAEPSEPGAGVLCLLVAILAIGGPFIGNKVTAIPSNEVILTDTYDGVKYSKVMKVEYDISHAPWWTYSAIGNGKRINIRVSEYNE